MSSSKFRPESDFDDTESIVLKDEQGRSLECYIENSLETGELVYMLLTPVGSPVLILVINDEDEEEEDVLILEDSKEIDPIFADAKAVLSELNLTLHYTAYTLTVSGELPSIEDESILSLSLDGEEEEEEEEEIYPSEWDGEGEKHDKTEELQFLASFYSQEQKYSIYTPLAPLLFVASYDKFGKIELISSEDENLQPILEELLFEEEE